MKWIFSLLVALNILVLGFNIAGKLAEKQKVIVKPTVPMSQGEQQLVLPIRLPEEAAVKDASTPEWITKTIADGEVESDKNDKSATKAENIAAQNNRQSTRKDIDKTADEPTNRVTKACTVNASITLDEDDYHRIKGLLGSWPHAATRSIEKRPVSKKNTKNKKSYRVLLPTQGDALAELNRLAAKGFSAEIYQGSISAGVVGSKSAAQILVSRLTGAGFGGATVQEQKVEQSANAGLTIAKMKIIFFSVDDAAFKEISRVLNPYGRLKKNSCR